MDIKVPQMGESISEVTIDKWLLKEGEAVERDKPIAVLESDKATVELPAESAGTLTKILKKPGDTAKVGEVIAVIDANAKPSAKAEAKPEERKAAAPREAKSKPPERLPGEVAEKQLESKPVPQPPPPLPASARVEEPKRVPGKPAERKDEANGERAVSPAPAASAPVTSDGSREEEVVHMTRLRQTIARRLVDAQRNAALLTTFNEVDLSAVTALRKQFGEAFLAKYQIKLGFMSFFVKAVIDALKLVPQVNAEVRGDDIVFKNYYDIAVAIGGGKGLVVPVIRNAERLSFAEVELAIADFGKRAKENTLKPEELQGGTFTISNGGIYGSLLSTPIINPPQSGILGMHAIQDRPVAREGQVVVRPMMYIALTYDHRIVDGREAVTFLKRVKESIEEPARMLIEV
jgi:2-oxoglutarate dehydrogenase E2 component (dihydrolipoamide succinyltransferase)